MATFVQCFVQKLNGRVYLHASISDSFVSNGLFKPVKTARREPLVEQELGTLSEHLSSPPVFSGIRVAQSLVFCVVFVDHSLTFSSFSFFCNCIFRPS